jgi:uncharacterized protein YbdZ (MbtH family)
VSDENVITRSRIRAVYPTEQLPEVSTAREDLLMTDPFEDPNANYFVLVNEEGQHSLWPAFAEVPGGWDVAFGEAGRQECLDFIEKSWVDMRPNSLIAAMQED